MTASFSFPRYLAAKKSVDDRALNRLVLDALRHELSSQRGRTLQVLEIGAGIGTMFERLLEWGMLDKACYTAIDGQQENILVAQARLPEWARRVGYRVVEQNPAVITIEKPGQNLEVHLQSTDLFDLLNDESSSYHWDLLIAHAFLDLINIPETLPRLMKLLKPGGLYYFTINFDGGTAFEPVIEPKLENQILTGYHRTMDERTIRGRPSGDSQTGRHLFQQLASSGAQILAVGASDWVVFPQDGKYPGDEAYFLHCIVTMVQHALEGSPTLDLQRLQSWCELRHAQIERGELLYIAHQLDFAGTTALLPG